MSGIITLALVALLVLVALAVLIAYNINRGWV